MKVSIVHYYHGPRPPLRSEIAIALRSGRHDNGTKRYVSYITNLKFATAPHAVGPQLGYAVPVPVSNKRRGIEPVFATLRAVAHAIGIPFPKLAGRQLPMDMMLKASEWFATRELVALRQAHSVIQLEFVRLPTATLDERHVRALRIGQQTDMIRHVELWRNHVLHLELIEDFTASRLPDFMRMFSKPTFGALQTLTAMDRQKEHLPLTPLIWQQILSNCPKLTALELRARPAHYEMTQDGWLAPLKHRKSAWRIFSMNGIAAPPSVYLAVANPEIEKLATSGESLGGDASRWTLKQVQQLAAQLVGDEKQGNQRHVLLGTLDQKDVDGDAVAKIMLDHCPNLTDGLPWSRNSILRLSGDTIRRMYATWPITQVPPPFQYIQDEDGGDTRLNKTLVPTRTCILSTNIHENVFFRKWTMGDFERLLLSSDKWEKIQIPYVYAAAEQTPSFDAKVLTHLLRHGTDLERISLGFPCALRDEHLSAMLACPKLWGFQCAEWTPTVARFHLDTIRVDTLQRVAKHLLQNRPPDVTGLGAFSILCGIVTNLNVDDWVLLIDWWHTVLRPWTPKFIFQANVTNELADELKLLRASHIWPDIYFYPSNYQDATLVKLERLAA